MSSSAINILKLPVLYLLMLFFGYTFVKGLVLILEKQLGSNLLLQAYFLKSLNICLKYKESDYYNKY